MKRSTRAFQGSAASAASDRADCGAPNPESILIHAESARPWPAVACSLVLFASVLAVYWQVGSFEFVHYDDPGYLLAPSYVRDGLTWNGVVSTFTQARLGNWHPITMLSYLADVQLWGLRPGPAHLMNVAYHAANSVLLFLLLRRLTHCETRSAVVAALFALHPLHVESVAWVAERKDVLSTFFFILTIWIYTDWARRPTAWRYALLIVIYALGLMSKSMLVTVPFLLLLLDYWPLGRFGSLSNVGDAPRRSFARDRLRGFVRLSIEKLPLFAMAAAMSVVSIVTQRGAGAMMDVQELAFSERLSNAAVSYLRYLAMMVWPANLSALYPLHPVGAVAGVAAGAVIVAISLAAIRLARRMPYLFVGWFWYAGMLVPVSGISQVGSQAYADRYTYVTLIGIFIAIVWAVGDWLSRRSHVLRMGAGVAAAGMIVACSIAAWFQVGYWRNTEALYGHALDVDPHNAQMHYNLATFYFEKGRYAEADPHFAAAVWLLPERSLCNWSLNLAAEGRQDEAAKALREAARRSPNSADVHTATANVALLRGDVAMAEREATESLRLDPASATAHFALGRACAAQHRFDEAASHFRAVIGLTDAADAHAHLALVLAQRGGSDEAIGEAEKAINANPNDPIAHEALGYAHLSAGRLDQAKQHFEAASRAYPSGEGRKTTMLNLGLIAARQKRFDEAAADFREVLATDPADARANFQIGLIAQSKGDAAAAINYYRAALAANPASAARNNLAWILSTSPDAGLRNGAEAVQILKAGKVSGEAPTDLLDTLAAADAEAGDFAGAVDAAERAVDSARREGKGKLASEIEQRLALYRRGKPYRESPPGAAN
jgi:tetratricopeptide (TPR) repeat protein